MNLFWGIGLNNSVQVGLGKQSIVTLLKVSLGSGTVGIGEKME